MDVVIYTATPLRAFAGGIFLIVFLFGLGLVGAVSAIFNRRGPYAHADWHGMRLHYFVACRGRLNDRHFSNLSKWG